MKSTNIKVHCRKCNKKYYVAHWVFWNGVCNECHSRMQDGLRSFFKAIRTDEKEIIDDDIHK